MWKLHWVTLQAHLAAVMKVTAVAAVTPAKINTTGVQQLAAQY
jgi:hypothetical protein